MTDNYLIGERDFELEELLTLPDPPDHMATVAEADREWAHNVGAMYPERAWILSDRDVWYRNPSYCGSAVPHPEDYDG